MRLLCVLRRSFLTLCLAVFSFPINAETFSGHINGILAVKVLDSDNWSGDTDTHNSAGLLIDIEENSWPFSIAMDFIDTGGKDKHDGAAGLWLGAGTYYEFNPKFVMGGDIRYSSAEVTLFNSDIDAGGLFAGLFLGYQF